MRPARPARPAYEELADRLRARILSGELVPGDRLPIEPDLCEQYGVSRTTVREALRQLSSQNLIMTTRGVTGGSYVRAPEPAHIRDFLEASIGLLAMHEGVTVDALVEVRDLLEVPAARLAAERRTAAHLERLRAAAASAPGDEKSFERNWLFHVELLQATGNPLLEVVAQPVFRVLQSRFVRDRAPELFWTTVDHDHREILHAIEAGDGDAAEETTRRHLEHLRLAYRRIDGQGSDGHGSHGHGSHGQV
jgi:DNA-binding FadR family transcriptional regulator